MPMTIKVAINGFGRIGRNVLRGLVESGKTDIQVVAINDLGPVETNAHLMRYDSVHGRFPGTVTVDGDSIDVGTGPIRVTAERDPRRCPGPTWTSRWSAPASSPRAKRRRCTWRTGRSGFWCRPRRRARTRPSSTGSTTTR